MTSLRQVTELSDGLAYLHEKGVVHGDVKPSNILVTEDHSVKICDFGLSRQADATRSRSQNEITGGLCYLSPERVMGGSPRTKASDVFAYGMTVYEASYVMAIRSFEYR